MILDLNEFNEAVSNYYDKGAYEDGLAYLASKEKEVKYGAVPQTGCMTCGGGEPRDKTGLTATERRWYTERNLTVATILYEQGRFYNALGDKEKYLKKYKEAKEMMERGIVKLVDKPLYETLVKELREVGEV
ncbi:MAG: hypothetical protein LUD24_02090 [Phascolarctobacterium sp.]|nr:hypothetical protein [Phascolarctobacterium sp.]